MISGIIFVPTVVCNTTNLEDYLLVGDIVLIRIIGTPLFGRKVNSEGEPDESTVVRAGILDNIGSLNEQKPQVEIYTDSRLGWISPIEGARQFQGMLSL